MSNHPKDRQPRHQRGQTPTTGGKPRGKHRQQAGQGRVGAHGKAGPDPRTAARAMLAAIRDGANLDEAAACLDRPLSGPDAARAHRLVRTVLRFRGRADAVLAPLLARQPRPAVMDALRLAVTEMLALGEAPHGVVNATVGALRNGPPKLRAAAGMANAVLRRAADAQAVWDAAAPVALPAWLRDPIIAAWGDAAARAIEAAHEAGTPLDLTLKPGMADDQHPEGAPLPTGSLRLAAPGQISTLPGYADGAWWVQDAAAALPARLLDAQPGEDVADLCAAPGGKTMQLAAAGARVTAVDISAHRMMRLAENLTRTGLSAHQITSDVLVWQPGQPFDAVLLDAPCSATGTIRRHPELPMLRDGSGLDALTSLQAQLIDHALAMLKPGGRLVYAVCSLLPAEGEDQLTAALARHAGLRLIPAPADRLGIPADWLTPMGAIRTRPDFWPELGGLDGFFIAALTKAG